MKGKTEVKFVAKCHNQVLTVKPSSRQIIDGVVLPVEGKRIAFYRHEYTTSDPAEIDFIRNHKLFNVAITESETVAAG